MKTFKEYLLGNKTSYPKYAKITNLGQEDLKRIIKDKKSWESRYTWTDGYDDEQDVEELYKNFKRRGVFIKDGPRLYTAGLSFIGMTEFISGFTDSAPDWYDNDEDLERLKPYCAPWEYASLKDWFNPKSKTPYEMGKDWYKKVESKMKMEMK